MNKEIDTTINLLNFNLPEELKAKEPPEMRGIPRDKVKLMVVDRKSGKVTHSYFNNLAEFLKSGDLLVFNSSRTLPASLKTCGNSMNMCLEIRLAEHLPDDTWLALLLCTDGDPFACGLRENMIIEFGLGLTALVEKKDKRIPRLWKIRFSRSGPEFVDLIYRLGQPIRYSYISEPWTLDYYQTVYAKEPGSVEMPSAGRAFTWKMLLDLKRMGVETGYLTLHTGLSSYMDDEYDSNLVASEEEYFINEKTSEKIEDARRKGGRIIAIGTTVVRALESAVNTAGFITPGHGYTILHINKDFTLKTADGLITGLHEPGASHLDLLSAFLPVSYIQKAYDEAIQQNYLWHEFGDLNLILQAE